MRTAAVTCLAVFTALAAGPASAQWLKVPTAGIPRDANGKPNLAAPAPQAPDGRPDLSGLWQLGSEIGYAANITTDLAPADVQPWAAALSRDRMGSFGKDDPETVGCKPGGPRHITRGGLTKIIQTPALIIVLFEDLSYRQIFLDGRPLPKNGDVQPWWYGYSTGHWDGDTLVVLSNNFRDDGWLDINGSPLTDQATMTERYTRPTYGTLRSDAVQFKDIRFDYCILDEAQAIKNSSTLAAKAVRLLKADHRLAMSGTPVENHLGELWSLFEFLNPGMLGTASVFARAGKNPDESTRQVLGRALRPFILRRTKGQVAPELPEKTEQTLYCELETEQRKLYEWRQ